MGKTPQPYILAARQALDRKMEQDRIQQEEVARKKQERLLEIISRTRQYLATFLSVDPDEIVIKKKDFSARATMPNAIWFTHCNLTFIVNSTASLKNIKPTTTYFPGIQMMVNGKLKDASSMLSLGHALAEVGLLEV